jgi:hypothetical protein
LAIVLLNMILMATLHKKWLQRNFSLQPFFLMGILRA